HIMGPENLQQEGAAQYRIGDVRAARSAMPREIVAFKFGGSSLLGAERMLHAARLVRAAAATSGVSVVVSAMKGVTGHLLSIANALAKGRLVRARREAEVVLALHFDVLQDLRLEDEDDLRVRRELQLLGGDLLHEVPEEGSVTTCAELFDRLLS